MVKRICAGVDMLAAMPWAVRFFAAVLIVCGPLQLAWHVWDRWPRGQPAFVTSATAVPEWAGKDRGNLVLVLTVRLTKLRTDCSFSDDRWVEPLIPPPGEPLPRFELGGARAQWVDTLGDATVKVRIDLDDDLGEGVWVLRTKGQYRCRDGIYPSDPLEVRFTLPPA